MIDGTPAPGARPVADGTAPLSTEAFDQPAIIRRLNRIEGQIRGIRRMVEEPRPCIEVLQQLAAAEAALNRISLVMFRHHIDHCVWESLARGEDTGRTQLHELVTIFDRFGR